MLNTFPFVRWLSKTLLLSVALPVLLYEQSAAQCFPCDNIIPSQGASSSGNVSPGCVPSPTGMNYGCQGYRINSTSNPAIIPGGTVFFKTGNGGSCSPGGMSSVFVEIDGDCVPPPVGLGQVSTSGAYEGIISVCP